MLRDMGDLDGICPLLHNRRNVYGPNIELDKDDILCLVFNIDMRAKG